jgi:hypothetical protein
MNQLLPSHEGYSIANRAGAAELINAARDFTTETLVQPELERPMCGFEARATGVGIQGNAWEGKRLSELR